MGWRTFEGEGRWAMRSQRAQLLKLRGAL